MEMKLFSRGRCIGGNKRFTKEWLGKILQEEDKEVWIGN